jgi:glycosyltransferase involved in cell wall biosynthesis
MNIKITGCADARDGYGEITQNLALTLDKLGHNVWINPVKIWFNEASLRPRTKQLLAPIKPDFEFIIMYPTYNFGMIHKKAAIMTMWEANVLPSEWVTKLNQLKLPVFAPSQFVADIFKDSGIKVKIKVLPLGIDTEFYSPMIRVHPSIKDKNKPFRFFTMGKLEARKAANVALRAFQNAFKKKENVELIFKSRERFMPKEIYRAAQNDNRIKIIEKTLSEEELRKLFYYADAFVYPSRGEGFAFPPRYAVATGMPTLVTGWSALEEIPGAIKIALDDFSPMPPCGFSYGKHEQMLMANIDEVDLTCTMQDIYNDPEFYNKVAKKAYDTEQISWEACAKNFIDLVGNK